MPLPAEDRWSRVEDLLDRLLELPVSERRSALAGAEQLDAEIAREAAELLSEVDPPTGDLLDQALREVFPQLLGDVESALDAGGDGHVENRRLGSYRLLRVLGRGGMGVVYLGERADRQFEKAVAIKLVPWGLETAETVRRFALERQVLARLEHPNIARLLDGGVTEEGYPYLVMELVDGEPIDVHCRGRTLGLRDRISLFLGVCDAVQYAHQNLVIHRDIKPANILVTPEGAVKLLDFGVAKLTQEGAAEATAGATRFQPRTPAYAAPEQMANRSVSTASDVYSLGVVLYRLLTGRPPYELDGLSATEAEAVVRDCEPARPSTVATAERSAFSGAEAEDPRDTAGASSSGASPAEAAEDLSRWARRLRGDLDRILLKALEKDTDRRYATAEALAEDLRRYLRGLPVIAREPTWGYRTRKLLLRHRVGAAAAGAVVVAVAVALGGIAWQARRAAREAQRATVVAELLTSIFADGDPYEGSGREMTVLELLDRGLSRVREQFEAQPAIKSDLVTALAKAYSGQGQIEKAIDLHREALADRRRLYGPGDARVLDSLTLLGGALHGWGRYDEAQSVLEEALALAERAPGADSAEASDVLLYLGNVRQSLGDYQGSARLFREALAIRERLATGPDFRVANALLALSGALDLSGHDDEGLELLHRALAIAEQTMGEDHPYAGSMRNDLGIRLQEFGDLEEATVHFRRALEIQESTLGAGSIGTADASNNLGNVLMQVGDFAGAGAHIERAAELNRLHLEPTNFSRIASEINLATLRLELGALDQAETLYRDALERFATLLGERHQATARARTLLARCLHLAGSLEEAESQFRHSLEHQRESQDPMRMAETLIGLAALLSDTGRAGAAEPLLREALELRSRERRPVPWRLAEVRLELGGALLRQGKVAEAEELVGSGGGVLADVLPQGNFRQARRLRLLEELAAAPGESRRAGM